MMLVVTILISLILSLLLSIKFKNYLILVLVVAIPSVVFLEILITKDIAAFYYRYYYHWLFLLPIILSLPLSFFKNKINKTFFLIIIFFAWGYFFIQFPIMNVSRNIKSFNSDSTWFDAFARKYALGQISIYDYIDWQFPKTKEVVKWCENQKDTIDVYAFDPQLRIYDSEKGFKAFLIGCNYNNYHLQKEKTSSELFNEIISSNWITYFLSLELCNSSEFKNPFNNETDALAYEVNQMLVCSSKQVFPNVFKIMRK